MGTDLVTLAEYKTYAGISSPNEDTKISDIIPKASALIKSICRRTFVDYVDDMKVEVFASGADKVYVGEFPIINIDSVEYSDDYGATYTTLTEYTDYVVSKEDGVIHFLGWESVLAQLNAYRITYTGGYEELPEDLKMACLNLVNYYLKNDMSVKSQRDAGSNKVQIEYIIDKRLPAPIQWVLNGYIANVS